MPVSTNIAVDIIMKVLVIVAIIALMSKFAVKSIEDYSCRHSINSQLDNINSNSYSCDINERAFPKEFTLELDSCVEYMYYENGKMFIKFTDSKDLAEKDMLCAGTKNKVDYVGFSKDKKNIATAYQKEYKLKMNEPGIVIFGIADLCSDCSKIGSYNSDDCDYCRGSGLNDKCYYDYNSGECRSLDKEYQCLDHRDCLGYCDAICLQQGKGPETCECGIPPVRAADYKCHVSCR